MHDLSSSLTPDVGEQERLLRAEASEVMQAVADDIFDGDIFERVNQALLLRGYADKLARANRKKRADAAFVAAVNSTIGGHP